MIVTLELMNSNPDLQSLAAKLCHGEEAPSNMGCTHTDMRVYTEV